MLMAPGSDLARRVAPRRPVPLWLGTWQARCGLLPGVCRSGRQGSAAQGGLGTALTGLFPPPQAGGAALGGAAAAGVQMAGHAEQLGQVDGQEAQEGERWPRLRGCGGPGPWGLRWPYPLGLR